jgi:hypothetical protein
MAIYATYLLIEYNYLMTLKLRFELIFFGFLIPIIFIMILVVLLVVYVFSKCFEYNAFQHVT